MTIFEEFGADGLVGFGEGVRVAGEEFGAGAEEAAVAG